MGKKYINPPFNYSTSKYKLLNQLIPNFDFKKRTFIDLFTGSGAVYCNILNDYDKILANDIISNLIGIHKYLTISDKIINDVKTYIVDKNDTNGFIKLKNDYNNNPTPAKLWALMICSNNLRFDKNNNLNQLHGKRTFNSSLEYDINNYASYIRQFKNKIIYRDIHYKNIPLTVNAFYFIDSPYGYKENKSGSISKVQIMNSGDKVHYTQNDDIELYHYIHRLNEIGASFMIFGLIEYEDKKAWLLNKLLNDGFSYKYINMKYKKTKKKYKEVIIYNYDI